MKTLVRLVGKGNDSVAFIHNAPPEDVAYGLGLSLGTMDRGPLDTLARYIRNGLNTIHMDFYPTPTTLSNDDVILDVRKTNSINGSWTIAAEKVTGRTPTGVTTESIGDFNKASDLREALINPKQKFKFEKNKLYIFVYNGGTKPGSTRFAKIQEIERDSILCDDLAVNEPRRFKLKDIENPREVS